MYLILLTLATNQCTYKENIVTNNCDFQILRFNRNQVKCHDTGQYEKYCNHYAIPNEFQVMKEVGIGNQDVYTFKPQAIYTESHNSKRKDASFYYKFTCDNKNNNPNLELTIYPTSDVNPVVTLIVVIIIFVLVCMLIGMCTDNNSRNNNDFALGYIIGNLGSNSNRRTYCE